MDSPLRVLVVDDDHSNRMTTVHLLRLRGCKVTGVADGAEALEVLRATPYDVVLMDVIMPCMNGLDAARKIREDPRLLPVVIGVTGYDTESFRQTCRDAGMSAVLCKPISARSLYEVLGIGPG